MVNKKPHFAQMLLPEFEDTYDMRPQLCSENELISAALSLGAREVGTQSEDECRIWRFAEEYSLEAGRQLRKEIAGGGDPLGEALCTLRSPETRRNSGATYTPKPVVEAMISWATALKFEPSRIVDPGTGSARFLMAAARVFPKAQLLGIESDPVAATIARANLAALGLAKRATVIVADYRRLDISEIKGRTLYVGNPPYVRHHQLDTSGKSWLSAQAEKLGLKASQLAGLHVHFFLATALKASKGDLGVFITSAEWLDVNYGGLLRQLFLGQLGGQGITIIEPTSRAFSDAATTAAITQFRIGSRPGKIRLSRSKSATSSKDLVQGRWINRERFDAESRWSVLSRPAKANREGYVELGELCQVHRGQVTGANRVWIAAEHGAHLPASVLFPSVTRAKELFQAGEILSDISNLRDVIDISPDLTVFSREERREIDNFLVRAKALGADLGYVAKNRKAWWSVGLRSPAPILATYMARRKPAFVRNIANARHINIAHGIYPREALAPRMLDRLAHALSSTVSMTDGRTYSGGLTKFEPKEMERILIPNPLQLNSEQVA
jgi:hypothetical protein